MDTYNNIPVFTLSFSYFPSGLAKAIYNSVIGMLIFWSYLIANKYQL